MKDDIKKDDSNSDNDNPALSEEEKKSENED